MEERSDVVGNLAHRLLRVNSNKVNVGGIVCCSLLSENSVTFDVNDWPFSHKDLTRFKGRLHGHFSFWGNR